MSAPNRYGSSQSKAQAVFETRGGNGSLLIDDTTTHEGKFTNFTALELSVGAFVGNVKGDTTSVTIPAGSTLYGTFSSITLASGSGQAFYS